VSIEDGDAFGADEKLKPQPMKRHLRDGSDRY
jgi:hypothetical protein